MSIKYYCTIVVLFCLTLKSYGQVLQFRNVGPSRGGRVTAVKGVETQPNVFYMGATGGGLWKTEDYGYHWKNISDGFFATPSIGAIGICQSNANVIYVGTGSDAIRSNVIVGKGIYKSKDAGKSWDFAGLEGAGQIGAIEIHPENPDVVYAAVVGQPFKKSIERGVYKTIDGGGTWQKVLYHSDSVGAVDIEFAPDNPEIIYATMWRAERKPWTIISGGATDGIFKSTDGGKAWKRLEKGLPTSLFGKADLAVSSANPARVWAQIQASNDQGGIYKSDDYGETWSQIEMPKKVHKSVMYRPFYFTNIDANPGNADNIWVGTKLLWTSYDAGITWKQITPPHADHHDLWINPSDSLLMVTGNDGGGSISRDGGANWTHQFNQPTAELYSCYVDDQYPYYLYSGQQDNSTIRLPSRKPGPNTIKNNDNHGLGDVLFWEAIGGCETGPVIPKPGNSSIVYANCKGQFSVYNHLTGRERLHYVGAESLYGNHPDDITYRFQRVTPMEVSPHNPNTVYYGSQYLHKTQNGGIDWTTISPDLTANDPLYRMRSGGPIDEDISGEEYYAVLYAIQESPIEQGVIWTGSNDGLFYVSRDGGQTWMNVTPDMPPGGRVSNIEASPFDPAKAYYAVNRDYLGDEKPYFYRTNDYGNSWTRMSNGIPVDHPARVVREDPNRKGLLYAGTEFGLFISFDDGQNWEPFQRNLPVVPVTDLQVARQDLVVSTLGRSFWILDDLSPLYTYKTGDKGFTVYQPRDVIDSELQYIHFTLPKIAEDTLVTFTFSRESKVVHTKQEALTKLVPDNKGMRRTEWDLRFYLKDGQEDFKGPKVAPGKYVVHVIFNGDTLTTDFELKLNPDLMATGISENHLMEQERLALDVARLLISIKTEIRQLETQIIRTKNQKKKSRLAERLVLLKKGSERYDQPRLKEHVNYLYRMVTKFPQEIGADGFSRLNQLKKDWIDYRKQYISKSSK